VTWQLSFRHPQSLAIEDSERALSVLVGPVTTTLGDLVGNPRDFYNRDVTITGTRGDLSLTLRASQSLRGEGDPEAYIGGVYVTVAAPYAAKLATWDALAASFTALGCRDETPTNASAIVDDADAAGDTETSTRVRALVLAALLADARASRWVRIVSPRIDIEPVLAAYASPEDISSMTLYDCGLRAPPAGLTRFPNLRSLDLYEPSLDVVAIVRAVSLPALESLSLSSGSPWRLAKDDLAGFPALGRLTCYGALEDIDSAIVDAYPLVQVLVDGKRWSP
jgi:hypothetical protein